MSFIQNNYAILDNALVIGKPVNIQYVVVRHKYQVCFLFYLECIVVRTEVMPLTFLFDYLGCHYFILVVVL